MYAKAHNEFVYMATKHKVYKKVAFLIDFTEIPNCSDQNLNTTKYNAFLNT